MKTKLIDLLLRIYDWYNFDDSETLNDTGFAYIMILKIVSYIIWFSCITFYILR
jgi:hypothetical protein